MHIKKIEIKNFRNFSSFTIDFTDGFQTIIGENNIGKSNLYWAIRLVLDKNLSYNFRHLEENDFYGFPNLDIDSFVSISIEFYGENLSSFPNLHAIKTTDETLRISYLYAHKSNFMSTDEVFNEIEINDFQWRLFGGGNTFSLESIEVLSPISFKDIEGINLFYISGFRNINSDLFGRSKSLLSQYCETRENAKTEAESVNTILSTASEDLSQLEFVPKISEAIESKNEEIAGKHFTFPVSLGFLANNENDVWNQLKMFFTPRDGKDVPLRILGLGPILSE